MQTGVHLKVFEKYMNVFRFADLRKPKSDTLDPILPKTPSIPQVNLLHRPKNNSAPISYCYFG